MTEDILIRFINNECSDDEIIAVKTWIEESEDNAAQLFEMERIAMAAGDLHQNVSESRERVLANIRQRVMADNLLELKSRRKRLLKWWSSAAAVIVIALTSVFIFRQPDVRMLEVQAMGETLTITLPDGSTVYLKDGSKLMYPETFAAATRNVKLDGEGFFKVTHDSNHPFKVEGNYLNVSVLGTEFNFNSSDTINNVSLVEGSVKVTSRTGKDGVVLFPGQKADYDKISGNLTVHQTNSAVDAAWHNRIIPFENADIKDIAAIIEQLYNVKVVLDDITGITKTYSGATVYYESVDSTLSQLSNTLPIQYRHTGNTIIISQKQ